jgi:hypothetical protein
MSKYHKALSSWFFRLFEPFGSEMDLPLVLPILLLQNRVAQEKPVGLRPSIVQVITLTDKANSHRNLNLCDSIVVLGVVPFRLDLKGLFVGEREEVIDF